jgi:hypothetical protein
MPACVYCGQDGVLTREHVVPSFLYDYVDREALGGLTGWNEATKSRVGGEHKVKDVCANCNNIVLSTLDAYGKEFLSTNGLLAPLYVEKLRVRYDYDLLLRWLLKIQFNAARASKFTSPPSAEHVDYILNGRNRPPQNRVFLLCELLRPHKIEHPGSPYIGAANSEGLCNPFLVRLTRTHLEPRMAEDLQIESVCFGGLFFHLAYLRSSLPTKLANKLESRVVRENAVFSKLVPPNKDAIEVCASQRDFVDMRRGQDERERALREMGIDPYPPSV